MTTPHSASAAEDPILASVEPIEPRAVVPVIDLRLAVLCVGCDGIYPSESTDCPRCGSVVRFPVARVIRAQGVA